MYVWAGMRMRVCYSYFYTICYFFRIFVCHAAPPPSAPRQPPSTPQSLPFLYELLAHKTDAKFLWRQPMHNHTHTYTQTYIYIHMQQADSHAAVVVVFVFAIAAAFVVVVGVVVVAVVATGCVSCL